MPSVGGNRSVIQHYGHPYDENGCDCCPYGYHIDRDFVPFTNQMLSREREGDFTRLQELKDKWRCERQSMDELLGVPALQRNWRVETLSRASTDYLWITGQWRSVKLPDYSESDIILDEKKLDANFNSNLAFGNGLDEAVTDFEEALKRTKPQARVLSYDIPDSQKYHTFPRLKAPVLRDLDAGSTLIGNSSQLGKGSSTFLSTTSTSPTSTMKESTPKRHSLREFPKHDTKMEGDTIKSLESTYSHKRDTNESQHITMSIRLQNLEEQVKLIPELEVKLMQLKEEKRQLLKQLDVQKQNLLNSRVGKNYGDENNGNSILHAKTNNRDTLRSNKSEEVISVSGPKAPPRRKTRDAGVGKTILTRDVGVSHTMPRTRSIGVGGSTEVTSNWDRVGGLDTSSPTGSLSGTLRRRIKSFETGVQVNNHDLMDESTVIPILQIIERKDVAIQALIGDLPLPQQPKVSKITLPLGKTVGISVKPSTRDVGYTAKPNCKDSSSNTVQESEQKMSRSVGVTASLGNDSSVEEKPRTKPVKNVAVNTDKTRLHTVAVNTTEAFDKPPVESNLWSTTSGSYQRRSVSPTSTDVWSTEKSTRGKKDTILESKPTTSTTLGSYQRRSVSPTSIDVWSTEKSTRIKTDSILESKATTSTTLGSYQRRSVSPTSTDVWGSEKSTRGKQDTILESKATTSKTLGSYQRRSVSPTSTDVWGTDKSTRIKKDTILDSKSTTSSTLGNYQRRSVSPTSTDVWGTEKSTRGIKETILESKPTTLTISESSIDKEVEQRPVSRSNLSLPVQSSQGPRSTVTETETFSTTYMPYTEAKVQSRIPRPSFPVVSPVSSPKAVSKPIIISSTAGQHSSLLEDSGSSSSSSVSPTSAPILPYKTTSGTGIKKPGFYRSDTYTKEMHLQSERHPSNVLEPLEEEERERPKPTTSYGFLQENREKATPGKEMQGALKVLNDALLRGRTTQEVTTAISIILHEWFRVSGTKTANPLDVEDYLDSFESYSPQLLRYIVNMPDGNGNTAMHYAVSHGNFDVVSILLDSKVCDPNKANKAGYTSVMLVSLAKVLSDTHRQVVRRLFGLGDVNIKAAQHGQTALMLGASHGRLDTVRLLLEAGADINIQDEDGSTALMCASEHGHGEIVSYLLAQPDCDPHITDNDGSTALTVAMEAGHKDIGVMLYAHMHFVKAPSSPYSSGFTRRSRSTTPRSTPSSKSNSPITSAQTSPIASKKQHSTLFH